MKLLSMVFVLIISFGCSLNHKHIKGRENIKYLDFDKQGAFIFKKDNLFINKNDLITRREKGEILIFTKVPYNATSLLFDQGGVIQKISIKDETEILVGYDSKEDIKCYFQTSSKRVFRLENDKNNVILLYNDLNEAVKLLEEYLESDIFGKQDIFYLLGQVYFELEDYKLSAQYFEHSFEKDSKNIDLIRKLADAYLLSKDYENAEKFYTNLLNINDKISYYYTKRGIARYRLGFLQLAIQDLETSLELKEYNFDASSWLARIYTWAEAEKSLVIYDNILEKLLKSYSENNRPDIEKKITSILVNKADVLEFLNKFSLSRESYLQSLQYKEQAYPKTKTLYNLSLVSVGCAIENPSQSGFYFSEALKYCTEAVNLDPSSTKAIKLKEELKKINKRKEKKISKYIENLIIPQERDRLVDQIPLLEGKIKKLLFVDQSEYFTKINKETGNIKYWVSVPENSNYITIFSSEPNGIKTVRIEKGQTEVCIGNDPNVKVTID